MAAACGGFSIREYASNMMAVDVGKCWPFGGDSDEVKKEVMQALLPPITITKYRWWAHELDLLRSNGKGANHQELDSKDKSDEFVSKTVEADETSDALEGKTEEKFEKVCPVCRVFKALTVNAVNAHIDGCLADHQERNDEWEIKKSAGKSKSKAPKKRSIAEIFAVAPPILEYENDEDEDEEEDCGKQDEIGNCEMETIKSMKKRKKIRKPKRESSITRKKMIGCEGKLLVDYYRNSLTDSSCKTRVKKHIILGNDVPIKRKKSSLKCSSTQKNHKLEKSRITQLRSVAPVRSILKKTKVSPELNSPFISSLQANDKMSYYNTQRTVRHVRFLDENQVILGPDNFTASRQKDLSPEGSKRVSSLDVRGSDDVVRINSVVDSTDIQPDSTDNRDLLESTSLQRPLVSYCESMQHLAEKSVPMNKVLIPPDDTLRVYRQGFLHRHNPCVETQAAPNDSRTLNSHRQLFDNLVVPIRGVPLSENENRRLPYLPRSAVENVNGYNLHCKRFLSPDWRESRASCGEKRTSEEFFGLPLNSQGELIQLRSRTTSDLNQLREARSITASSSRLPVDDLSFLPISAGDYLNVKEKHFVNRELPKYHLDLFPSRSDVKGNQNMHIPEGITELKGIRREDLYRLRSSFSLMNVSSNGCNYLDQKGNGRIDSENSVHVLVNPTQQTMRLMGKDVAVGRSSKEMQGLSSSQTFWKNNETIIEHLHSSPAQDDSPGKRVLQDWWLHHPLERPKETPVHLSKFQMDQALQANLLMKAQQSRPSHPCMNNKQSSAVFPDANLIFKGNPGVNMYCRQNVPPSKSAFDFPFLHPDCGEHVKPAWFRIPESFPSSKYFPPIHCNSYPPITPGTNIQNAPSMRHFQEASYFCNPMFHHQLVPVIPGAKLTSAINTGYQNIINMEERLKSSSLDLKDSYPCKETKKRPAAKPVYSRKPPKIPNLKIRELLREKVRGDNAASCTIDGMHRSGGPIRLSAGAKHILKPSQHLDQNNSKPTHSTIPFDGFMNTVNIPESQKSTKIYSL